MLYVTKLSVLLHTYLFGTTNDTTSFKNINKRRSVLIDKLFANWVKYLKKSHCRAREILRKFGFLALITALVKLIEARRVFQRK